MEKFITYDKLSKKEKQKADSAKRRQWSDYGRICPVSQVVPNKKRQADRHMCRAAVHQFSEA